MQDSTAISFGDNRLPQRFWDKLRVDEATGCWEWMAARKPAGYGGWWYKGKQSSTHRDAYTELVGPIPAGLYIDHLCRNRACCNPSHLRAVTPRQNAIENSVSPPAVNSAKTHCDNGHPYPSTPLMEDNGPEEAPVSAGAPVADHAAHREVPAHDSRGTAG